MITIYGEQHGQEYEAALAIRQKVIELWPEIETRPKDNVYIYVGLKCYGESPQDVDLFVVGDFAQPKTFSIKPDFAHRYKSDKAQVSSFAWVIEEKSHSHSGIRFQGKHASVRYHGEWQEISKKNDDQKWSVNGYIKKNFCKPPWLSNFILFTGISEANLPARPHNMFAIDADFETMLNVWMDCFNRGLKDGVYSADLGNASVRDIIYRSDSFFRTLTPSLLDRRKMDQIAKKNPLLDSLGEQLGQSQISIRGRGGVGKTVMLQQLAYRAYDEGGKRSLILTYNHALVADIKRSMAQLGIGDSLERGTVQVRTVIGFITAILKKLGIYDDLKNPVKSFEASKQNFITYLKDGLLTQEDFETLTRFSAETGDTRTDEFYWDHIFIDEGQDWPEDEIQILQHFYGPERLIIADGVDQYIRPYQADWTPRIGDQPQKVQKLKTCLRMKNNLVTFVNAVAEGLDLTEWELAPNKDATGGHVKIFEGDLQPGLTQFYSKIADNAKAQRNEIVDLLSCVPPNLVDHNKTPPSAPGRILMEAGMGIWDATSIHDETRSSFPTSLDQYRIVQYDSCRGLEGWTTINFGLDDFFAYKYRTAQKTYEREKNGLLSQTEFANRTAALWLMIPLTRAMDSLILNISEQESQLKTVLKTVAGRYPDFVEWHKI